MWDIADAYCAVEHAASASAGPAQLLVLSGAYLGGAGPLQSASGLPFIRSRAFAASAAHRLQPFLVDAPYRKVDFEAEAEAEERSPRSPDAEELRALSLLETRLQGLRAEGHCIGGVLVEFVRAHDGLGLSRAYVNGLAAWAARHRLLLCEDAVLMGLRCGKPFASMLYPGLQVHWVAIGKLYGFSGVVQNSAADHHLGYLADVAFLNGYLTCTLGPVDVLRCRLILGAIATRRLCQSAASSGRRLLATLRASGLAAWGVGLAIWFEPHAGGILNANWYEPADGSTSRLLPPLTFGGDPRDIDELMVRASRHGLYSHLPAVLRFFHSKAERSRDTACRVQGTGLRAERSRGGLGGSGRKAAPPPPALGPPPWWRAGEVLAWHTQRIAHGDVAPATSAKAGAVVRTRIGWGQSLRVGSQSNGRQ